MSKTIVIIKFNLNSRPAYVVTELRRGESFTDFGWFLWCMKYNNLVKPGQFTRSESKAALVAFKKLQDSWPSCVGSIQYQNHSSKGSIKFKDGKVEFTPDQLERIYESNFIMG